MIPYRFEWKHDVYGFETRKYDNLFVFDFYLQNNDFNVKSKYL